MEAVPRLLGRYEVHEEIGRGMMGVVYRGHDPMLGRTVALKTVRLRFAAADEDPGSFERRFLAEARAAALLSHPAIVTVHDVGRDAATDILYIALEHIEGRTLLEMVREEGALPWPAAMALMGRLGSALDHAHRRGIVHRDVKPANVMVLPGGEPKLMDFGLARFAASEMTAPGEFFGTPCYMSPEQASGEGTLDGRSDLFSLGAVGYLMLTGRRAFDAPSVPGILSQVVHRMPAPLPLDTPEDVVYIVARCLAKPKGHRYEHAGLLVEDVDDVLAGRAPRHRAHWVPPPMRDGTHAVWAPAASHPGEPLPSPAAGPRGLLEDRFFRVAAGIGLSALILAGWMATLALRREGNPHRSALPSASAPVAVGSARLEVAFTHPFRRGTLRVFLDDRLILSETVPGVVTRDLVALKLRRGFYAAVREVAPGERTLRVVVVDEGGFHASRSIPGTFAAGRLRRLVIEVRGGVRKDLSVRWASGS